ncbi:hypothetical protein TNCV_4167581 [Trichonephila clavipes]|nr:hypothetical protein TNCV_4167581 [Trichonephila clavipes]
MWSVAKSPRVAEQCDVNIQSINQVAEQSDVNIHSLTPGFMLNEFNLSCIETSTTFDDTHRTAIISLNLSRGVLKRWPMGASSRSRLSLNMIVHACRKNRAPDGAVCVSLVTMCLGE